MGVYKVVELPSYNSTYFVYGKNPESINNSIRMIIQDPLEQFSIECFFSIFNIIFNIVKFFGIFSVFQIMDKLIWVYIIPHSSVGIIYTTNLILLLMIFKSVQHIWFKSLVDNVFNEVYLFVQSTIKQTINLNKYFFILIFFFLLLFIFINNIIGMFPYSLTITSHLIITLYISIGVFACINIIGVMLHKENFFILFLPEGVPVVIIPFLIVIEYISYFSRVFSLSIRLFANMLAGHILLKILISFVWLLVSINVFYWVLNFIPCIIIFIVFILEIIISFLQAYVFFILMTIYLKDVIHTH